MKTMDSRKRKAQRRTADGGSLKRMVGRGEFKLADGTECRAATVHGANIRFHYHNGFGWQVAYMPPWTRCQAPNDKLTHGATP